MERGSRKRSSSARSEKMERVGDRYEKNGGTLFDRPKPAAGCSANGEEEYLHDSWVLSSSPRVNALEFIIFRLRQIPHLPPFPIYLIIHTLNRV
jgi:hypothetical protein